jgi:hypothetical protein
MCLVLAGCGEDGSPAPTTAPERAEQPRTSLTVTVNHLGDGTYVDEWTLTCEPAGGTHPAPEAACAALADVLSRPSPPEDRMCAMVYFGDEMAMIAGTWRGRQIGADFARNDSCAEDDWQALIDVFQTGASQQR